MNKMFYCEFEQTVLKWVGKVMKMKLTTREEAAFRAAGEPEAEPEYMQLAQELMRTLTPRQAEVLTRLLLAFGALVRYERRWYFQKGYRAAKKKETG